MATVPTDTASAKIVLAGTNMGAVQFDAVIELNRYSPRSARHDYTQIFARYWVSRDYYTSAVVWAEPQSRDMFFAVQPPNLCVTSNKHAFNIFHDSIRKVDEAYTKPLSERSVLRQKFGGYSIGNIRFAEREALAERIYAADLRNWEDSKQTDEGVFDIAGGNNRDVARLKVSSNGQQITSMQLYNAEQRMLKDISYEYESKGGKSLLRRQTVALHERPMMVGYKGKGMRITLDGKEHWYRELKAKHHAGGRTCTVEYELVRLGDKEVSLPAQVTVRNGKDGRILRCVRMMNFKQIDLDAAGAEEAARRFGAVMADQREYDRLRLKYWKKAPNEIDKQDVKAIEQLRDRFEKAVTAAGISTGEKLKYLNISMNLNVILGDRSGLERHYKNYLSTLTENRLRWMTLVGGYGVIETSMFAERHALGKRLLSLWVDSVLDMHEAEAILLFARRQLAKSRLWPTAVLLEALLEAFTNKKGCSADSRFEAEALRCIALDGLCKLLRSDDVAKKGLIAEVQAAWAASTGRDGVDRMFAESVDEAERSFASLREPTESQQALKKQLVKIEQEMSKEQEQEPDQECEG
jgi:hypothetical protein